MAKRGSNNSRRACIVAYDGDRTLYNGWQSQSPKQSPRTTIVDTITKALNDIYKGEIKIMGSGRTDAGVHATGQVFHFDTVNYSIPADALTKALNTKLPPSIRIIKTVDVEPNFHAVHSSTAKTYKYRIINSQNYADASPFHYRYAFHYPLRLTLGSHTHPQTTEADAVVARLNKVLALYKGDKDYASFCASRSLKQDTRRTIYEAYARPFSVGDTNTNNVFDNNTNTNYGVEIFIKGSGFMHRMVRTMVGLAVVDMAELPSDKQLTQRMDEIFQGRNRAKAGFGAPPHGLYLHHVEYKGTAL